MWINDNWNSKKFYNIEVEDPRLIWLRDHIGPEDKVRKKFKEMFNERLKLLKEDNISVHDYFSHLPCLNIKLRIDLMSYFNYSASNLFRKKNVYFSWNMIFDVMYSEKKKKLRKTGIW